MLSTATGMAPAIHRRGDSRRSRQPVWFPDPSDPSRRRYFDGTTWTDNYAPAEAPAPVSGKSAKPGMSGFAKTALGVGGVILALVVFGSMGESDKKDKEASSTPTRSNSLSTTRTTQAKPSGLS